MVRVRYSREAKADLLDIWLWLAQDSVAVADQKIEDIACRASTLGEHPELGPARPDIAAEARSLVVERWLVIYVIDVDGILIVRVVDGARDLTKVF